MDGGIGDMVGIVVFLVIYWVGGDLFGWIKVCIKKRFGGMVNSY